MRRLLLLLPAAVACLRAPHPAAPRSTARPSSSPQPLLSRRWAVGGLSGLLATAPLSSLRAASASTAEAAAPARALPNALCDYVYELCGKVSSFVRECKVLGSPEQNSRVLLVTASILTIKQTLALLGIGFLDKI